MIIFVLVSDAQVVNGRAGRSTPNESMRAHGILLALVLSTAASANSDVCAVASDFDADAVCVAWGVRGFAECGRSLTSARSRARALQLSGRRVHDPDG